MSPGRVAMTQIVRKCAQRRQYQIEYLEDGACSRNPEGRRQASAPRRLLGCLPANRHLVRTGHPPCNQVSKLTLDRYCPNSRTILRPQAQTLPRPCLGKLDCLPHQDSSIPKCCHTAESQSWAARKYCSLLLSS